MMKAESYYCPSCGNRPYAAFVHCKLIEQLICADCDDVIRQYFQNKVDDQSSPPEQVVNLVACGNFTLDECRDLWSDFQVPYLGGQTSAAVVKPAVFQGVNRCTGQVVAGNALSVRSSVGKMHSCYERRLFYRKITHHSGPGDDYCSDRPRSLPLLHSPCALNRAPIWLLFHV